MVTPSLPCQSVPIYVIWLEKKTRGDIDCNPKVMFLGPLKAVRRIDKAKSALKIIISYNDDEELGITLATEKSFFIGIKARALIYCMRRKGFFF